jgi:hypothetical protein
MRIRTKVLKFDSFDALFEWAVQEKHLRQPVGQNEYKDTRKQFEEAFRSWLTERVKWSEKADEFVKYLNSEYWLNFINPEYNMAELLNWAEKFQIIPASTNAGLREISRAFYSNEFANWLSANRNWDAGKEDQPGSGQPIIPFLTKDNFRSFLRYLKLNSTKAHLEYQAEVRKERQLVGMNRFEDLEIKIPKHSRPKVIVPQMPLVQPITNSEKPSTSKKGKRDKFTQILKGNLCELANKAKIVVHDGIESSTAYCIRVCDELNIPCRDEKSIFFDSIRQNFEKTALDNSKTYNGLLQYAIPQIQDSEIREKLNSYLENYLKNKGKKPSNLWA